MHIRKVQEILPHEGIQFKASFDFDIEVFRSLLPRRGSRPGGVFRASGSARKTLTTGHAVVFGSEPASVNLEFSVPS